MFDEFTDERLQILKINVILYNHYISKRFLQKSVVD